MPIEIPIPIQYNPYKHHFRFLLTELVTWQKTDWMETKKAMLSIGNNLFDFYLGHLTPEQVCQASINYLKSINIFTETDFSKWFNNSGWKKITLPDESEWLVKKGNNANRYIHIHPAKFSKHTIRVRATTLKTVLTLCVHKIDIKNNAKLDLQAVNQQRVTFLKLSPIKSFDEEESAILQLWQLFANAGTLSYP
ncbi:hypothetical protein [Draconibacterium halophilum]|uniref:Uncharacterized protein n=1 Tax=Draconibacterium halophilum TaxID=2706887 RepID=A0A6C0RDL9_9BACT|nr:hypothetical protein [Draconibacterium halophilum]QIA08624.1 hypothetical protein G0Q07_13260 [Draconibacterium halophilum]